jgi:hypothetical protein
MANPLPVSLGFLRPLQLLFTCCCESVGREKVRELLLLLVNLIQAVVLLLLVLVAVAELHVLGGLSPHPIGALRHHDYSQTPGIEGVCLMLLMLWDQTLLKHRRISTVPLLSRDYQHGLGEIGLVLYLAAQQWGAG